MEYIESIGERIKNRRKELNLSVDEIAEALGKNRATIYRYESDEIENLPINIIKPLADILDTTPEYLMGWGEENSLNDIPLNIIKYYKELGLTPSEMIESYKKYINDSSEDMFIKYCNTQSKLSPKSLAVAKAYEDADTNQKKIVELTLDLDFSENNEYILNAAHEIKGSTDEDNKHDDELMNDDNF